MTIRKTLAFSLVLSFFLLNSSALAASSGDDVRYFVQTNKGFWKNTFNARNSFEDGFTADLSDWQIRIAKLAGVKIFPVKKLSILPAQPGLAVDVLAAQIPSIDAGKPTAAAKRKVPTEQLPWNIKLMTGGNTASTSIGLNVKVAVLDTGITKDHPDLKNRIKDCKDFTSAKSPLVDGKCDDRNGHGTHVSGIIAADGGDDQLGLYGVAPGADLMAYKVCDQNGSCWSDDIAAAVRLAADDGANIINLSLGSDQESSLITDAVNYASGKGVLVVAAAGNDGPYFGSIDYPAAKDSVISVGAIDSKLLVPDWSSRGINTKTKSYVREEQDMEVAAPGMNIESTWDNGGYMVLSGTSMAAPHVTGLAAKLWSVTASPSAALIRDVIHQQTRDLDSVGDDNATGWGLPTF